MCKTFLLPTTIRSATTLLLLLLAVACCDAQPQLSAVALQKPTTTSTTSGHLGVRLAATGTHLDALRVRLTDSRERCDEDAVVVRNVTTQWSNATDALLEAVVRDDLCGKLWVCTVAYETSTNDGKVPPRTFGRRVESSRHQGEDVHVEFTREDGFCVERSSTKRKEFKRNLPDGIRVTGLRVEATSKDPEFDEYGVPDLLEGVNHTLRLFGYGFNENILVTFTKDVGNYTGPCLKPETKFFSLVSDGLRPDTAQVIVNLPLISSGESFYVCVKETNVSDIYRGFVHQGDDMWIRLKSHGKLLPIWGSIIIIITCLTFSALFSGLNLGLMSMDKTELMILCNTGTPSERKYAKVIQPVREHGNYLLCSILLGNVFVNSIFTILLDDLTSGLIAVIFSTLAIVMFGEITPQAICSRHGLLVGAKTIHITKVVMILTFPLSYPISKLLDFILGEEIGNVYNRERLKELVKVTTTAGENDLDQAEVNIISGALELRKKTVADVMTRIEDVFMLDYDSVLDFATVSEIMKSGYSRIPVYEGTRQNIVTMLYIKDLAFVDPDDNTPLKTLCQFYQNSCNFVFEDVTLDVMFKIFKEGNKGHMAFVHRVNSEGDGDPFYETTGLITLEDVIEELIQAEIMDETDVFTDNRTKRRRNNASNRNRQDFTAFAERRGESNRIRISPQLTLAAYQYLSTSVEAFNKHVISETILRRLLKQDIVFHIKKNKDWRNDPAAIIYQRAKPCDYFVLILEGRVEVTVGLENLLFEGGPFTYFGTQALAQNVNIAESPEQQGGNLGSLESLNIDAMLKHTFSPDYTVRACTEVLYLRVKRSLYLAAKRATLMERSQKDNGGETEQYDDEVEKLLHSLAEDDTSIGRHTPRPHSMRNLNQQPSLEQQQQQQYSTTSPRSPPPPVSQSQTRDANGTLKSSSGAGDDATLRIDEEAALLPRSKGQ